MTRIFLTPEEFRGAISFYQRVFGVKCDLRFDYPEVGLELAQVGSVLLLAGSDENLRPFRETRMTFLVDSLGDFEGQMESLGATMFEAPKPVPTGRNALARHPDGTIVEYVEHDA